MTSIIKDLHQPHFCLFKQKLLSKQVATSISGNTHFRKYDHLHSFAFGYRNQTFYLLCIKFTVCHFYVWHSCSYFYESVVHLIPYLYIVGTKIENTFGILCSSVGKKLLLICIKIVFVDFKIFFEKRNRMSMY